MKKRLLTFSVVLLLAAALTSCSSYEHEYKVGKGSVTGVELEGTNRFWIGGLITGKTSNPVEMAGGATDYTVVTKHTFLDGMISLFTMGIYTPSTTLVIK